jgi:electron transfer flavoprotein alpha subunit
MKIVCFVNKYNGIFESAKNLSNDLTVASFDHKEEFADFIPDKTINDADSGSLFIEGVLHETDPDLAIFSDEVLIKESVSVFSGKKGLGLISHSNRLYMKEGKLIGSVPGWENLSAEVYSKTRPVLVVLKGEHRMRFERKNPKKVYLGETPDSPLLVRVEKGEENPLKSARIIVGIGRVVSRRLLPNIKDFAKEIGAEIACTRPVADMGILPNSNMIGDSGISVNPEIYIAFGISGAIQHLSGINAKYIIAVNIDDKAPIFEKATLAINASNESVITELKKWLKSSLP